MEIELNHKCKPEFQGEFCPEVNVDRMGVSIKVENKRISLTHNQFMEAYDAYCSYNSALTAALEKIKETQDV